MGKKRKRWQRKDEKGGGRRAGWKMQVADGALSGALLDKMCCEFFGIIDEN